MGYNKIKSSFSLLTAKLESELKTIESEHQEKFETQSKDFNHLNEIIMMMVANIEEMQRKSENFIIL